MEIVIRDKKYKIIKDYGDTVSSSNLDEIVTEYYDNFDYIVGDWAYGKIRLKGFYDKTSKYVKDFNNIDNVNDYIENSCAYGCKYFILQKVNQKGIEKEN